MEDKSYQELLNKVTHKKQRLFLEQYPKYKVSAETCVAIGISESTPRQWIFKDKGGVFNNAFNALKKEIDQDRLEKYEKELDKRVLESPSKQSDILLMFGLKAAHPEKYRDQTSQVPLIGNVTIKMDIPRPWQQLSSGDIIDAESKEVDS